ncbi:MAG: hypothetical protein KAF91_15535 [Nostoc sp. TH1S01]|nr:hypothetical protein [Nostoc sp. TH1S01]
MLTSRVWSSCQSQFSDNSGVEAIAISYFVSSSMPEMLKTINWCRSRIFSLS